MSETLAGDIFRVQDGVFVEASIWHWRAYFLIRDLSQWITETKMPGRAWQPVGGDWDALEDRLLARLGSVAQQWPPPQESAWQCLVCRDSHTIALVPCPACTRAPMPKARRKTPATLQTTQSARLPLFEGEDTV